ncbi:MAG: alanine racemase [Saprospiraceae bacterium]
MRSNYFDTLSSSLKDYKRAIPFLLIDLDRLDKNISVLQRSLKQGAQFRLVVKSLPSPELIKYIMDYADTKHLMVFHQPFLSDLSRWCDSTVDILMGKPMPIRTASYYYETLDNKNGFDPSKQLQWLVDTTERMEEYIDLAKKIKHKIRVNLEIDIGLRRGGFADIPQLKSALTLLRNHPNELQLSGLMGYDPHVVKLPKWVMSKEKAFQKANETYKKYIAVLKDDFSDLWHENLCFNGAGSPTISMHQTANSVLNDISAGSCLVKPTNFDIPSLAAYDPACFIATPVLKKMEGTNIPGLEKFKSLLNRLDRKHRNSYFIYGGLWMADYCYPPGLSGNKLFGSSTNQSMVNSTGEMDLNPGDFVFLRPKQSEFVLLQFGQMLAIREGKIQEEWTLLNQTI